MYWFCIGMMMSAPAFSAWLPCSHDSESMNSNWLVCWNFGRKSGDPMRPRPEPPKWRSIVMPGSPPATIGLVIAPGMIAADGGVRPNDCEAAWAVDCGHEMRNSLTIDDDRTRVQPPTVALVLIVWLPKADVPVPSTTPPNAPGICLVRFE